MNKMLEITISVIAAMFVLFTAMLDPEASMVVAAMAVVCFLVYKIYFSKEVTKAGHKTKKNSAKGKRKK